MNKLDQQYESGLWVPSYYGLNFTVAHKVPKAQKDQDVSFIVKTLKEAQAECKRRNRRTA